jgi:hypothetical protein
MFPIKILFTEEIKKSLAQSPKTGVLPYNLDWVLRPFFLPY